MNEVRICEGLLYIGRHIYITLTCHALTSIISTECTSSDGPFSGEWVLTDVADNSQLGKEERIGDKGTANLVDVDYCLFKVNVGSSLHVEYIVTFIFRLCFSLMYNERSKGQIFCFLLHMGFFWFQPHSPLINLSCYFETTQIRSSRP